MIPKQNKSIPNNYCNSPELNKWTEVRSAENNFKNTVRSPPILTSLPIWS